MFDTVTGKILQWCKCSTCGSHGSAIVLSQAFGRAASNEDAMEELATTVAIPVPDALHE